MPKTNQRCFCAFCRTPRLVYRKRHVSVVDIAMSALAASLVSFVVWQTIDPRALMFFALALGLAEVFIVFRFRLTIVCRKCGFDPVLYKRSPELAATRVKLHMQAWRENPASAFSAGPQLPVIRKKVPGPVSLPRASGGSSGGELRVAVGPLKTGPPAAGAGSSRE